MARGPSACCVLWAEAQEQVVGWRTAAQPASAVQPRRMENGPFGPGLPLRSRYQVSIYAWWYRYLRLAPRTEAQRYRVLVHYHPGRHPQAGQTAPVALPEDVLLFISLTAPEKQLRQVMLVRCTAALKAA
ncbi:hypothetical protein VTN00DRAFT_9443 [Thermoascus crustaceus]|uniref:uncharacterized protein n=1 Tax=Thermoascus crustaceus TaxID=5088 RepID=UPI003743CE72